MNRNFNTSEKAALFVASGGKCEITGEDLQPGWHADHIKPFSKGGETTLANGQATNPKANLQKGARMIELRAWQNECRKTYEETQKQNFLIMALPGAGKTVCALNLLDRLIKDAEIGGFVLVAPTDHLKRQWKDEAHKVFGLELMPDFKSGDGVLPAGFHGICTTYAQVAKSPLVFTRLVAKKNLALLCDEIHHAGESKSWGDGLTEAFSSCARRILLTGTPFRSDDNPIPYVPYVNGVCEPDFKYDYPRAISEQVIRRVSFHPYDGNMAWMTGLGSVKTASFSESLNEKDNSDRLRTALHGESEWLKTLLQEADQKLNVLRQTEHAEAGGLVVCMSQFHAGKVAELLRGITADQVTLVTSDEDDASEKIKRYAKGSTKWIVAVKMVSEGVDIKRLRVGVYATNVSTELYFRQVVGRVVRYMGGDDFHSDFFIPKDPALTGFAARICEAQLHALNEEEAAEKTTQEREQAERQMSFSTPISADNARRDQVILEGDTFSHADILSVSQASAQLGVLPEQFLKVKKYLQGHVSQPNKQTQTETVSLDDEAKTLRKTIQKRVNRLSFMRGTDPQAIHNEWMARGGKAAKHHDVEDSRRKLEWLNNQISSYAKS